MDQKKGVRYHVKRRAFLNRDAGLPAFVIGIVQDTSAMPDDDPKQPWKWPDVVLDLGDCNRRVSFDFPMRTRCDRAASLHKIRRLAEVVNAVRDALEQEVAAINARPSSKKRDD